MLLQLKPQWEIEYPVLQTHQRGILINLLPKLLAKIHFSELLGMPHKFHFVYGWFLLHIHLATVDHILLHTSHDDILLNLLQKGGYVFGSFGLSVCLFVVCGQHYSKCYERIGMKFYGGGGPWSTYPKMSIWAKKQHNSCSINRSWCR